MLPPYFPHGWVYDKALCAPDGMIENGSLQFGEEFLVQLSQLSPEFQPVVRFYKELRQAVGLTGETAVRVRKLLAGLERSSDPERFVTLLQLLFLIAQDGHCRPIGPGKFRGAKIHKNKQRLQDVYKYIVENYHRKITLEEIASYASMNKTAFCLFFKKATGESFVAYLNVFRLQMACTMLTRSSKTFPKSAMQWVLRTFPISTGHSSSVTAFHRRSTGLRCGMHLRRRGRAADPAGCPRLTITAG